MSRYQLLSIAEAAEQIGRKRWFMYKEIDEQKIAYCEIGGRKVIRQADLDAYVARSYTPALGQKKTKLSPAEVASQ